MPRGRKAGIGNPEYMKLPPLPVPKGKPDKNTLLLQKIAEKIKRDVTDYQAYVDMYQIGSMVCDQGNTEIGCGYLKWLSVKTDARLKDPKGKRAMLPQWYELQREILRTLAPFDFESYLLYVEWNRKPESKFYPPRREQLYPIVKALQDLGDGKLKLVCISLPPGTGKSTLAIFFLTWMAGKYPDEPILSASHSNSFIRGVYDECLRILDPKGEYLWQYAFPKVRVSNTNAKDCRIDLGKRKRFETLEFTSIGTGNAGLYRASRLLYCDDLVSGLEVAVSKERLDKLYDTYTTDLRQRKIGDHCGELHIATRWSIYDVIGRLERQYGKSKFAKFISVPALDENDESNFDYKYGVGFSTAVYREQREIMDDVSWRALYMNQPIEREGVLYHEAELTRYYDRPAKEPDAILAVCDTKDKGKDYCVMPILYQYGENYYVEDCICDNGKPEVVEARLAAILLKHKVQMCRFESNSAGGKIAEKVQEMVKAKGGRTNITARFTTANKETKIIVNSGYVKEHFLFKSEDVIRHDQDYRDMMRMLCSWTMAGRNEHDDVPDAMAMAALFVQSLQGSQVEIFRRPF